MAVLAWPLLEAIIESAEDRPRIVIAPGPRAAESALFAELNRLGAGPSGTGDADLLGAPIRVIVPSRSLRLHVASELVRRRGRAVAGLAISTHLGLARQVMEGAGEEPPAGDGLFEVLARRLAREVPSLAGPLDGLVEGYGAVAGTVRDFLDAGLLPEHAGAVAEAAAGASAADGTPVGTAAERERAESLVHLAAGVERAMAALGTGRSSHLLRRATELLAAEPADPAESALLPARAVVIHGFGDATGVAADLLELLLRRPGSVLVLDRPPVPSVAGPAPAGEPPGRETAFTARFLERMARVAASVEEAGTPDAPPRLAAFTAPGSVAEAREVARRIRGLLDDGAAPETIGVVARDLAPDQPHVPALRRAFAELGVPFSGVGAAGPLLPAGRRLRALLEILRRREAAPAERWLDVLEPTREEGVPHRPFELRLAFHALGAARLRDVAALPPERFGEGGFPLPVRQGLWTGAGEEGASPDAGGEEAYGDNGAPAGGRPARRRVPSAVLRRAAGSARDLVERLRTWPERAPARVHLEHLRTLLDRDLEWRPAEGPGPEGETPPGAGDPWPALAALEAEIDPDLPLERDEVVLLLRRSWERGPRESGRDLLGGSGGGVAVLDAIEARGRTFRHLFVVSLVRGHFPRPVQEDPLLADDLRRNLLDLLPDLPVKLTGFDEERHLFAQLLAAAPEVTLSWRTATEEGQPVAPSPLVERLGLAAEPAPDAAGPKPAFDRAVAAGIAGDRDAFVPILATALGETPSHGGFGAPLAAGTPTPPAAGRAGSDPRPDGPPPIDPAERAAVHRRVLDEMDPDPATADGRARGGRPGPYHGFLGPPGPGDPRLEPLWVTALESLAGCPWQTFLRRLLRLEATPDPLQALPSLSPLLVGSLVHAALEEVVRRAFRAGDRELPADLAGAVPAGGAGPLGPPAPGETPSPDPVDVPWPGPEELRRILRSRAETLLAEEGVSLPGLARALAATALPFVEAAGRADWRSDGEEGSGADPPGPAVLAAEVEGGLAVTDAAGRDRELRFRADRVDLLEGRRTPTLRLTDYKTGRPISDRKLETTRRNHFLQDVQAGRRLQAVAYALAAAGGGLAGPDALGRYLFLRPELAPEHREADVWARSVPFAEAFQGAVATALEAWDRGAFFPRLVEPDRDQEPARCRFCEVHEACLRGDSGARRRLGSWAAARSQPSLDEELTAQEGALVRLWNLPSKEGS